MDGPTHCHCGLRLPYGPPDADVVREVLIQATDIVPNGAEPYVGWSAVLADRIVDALEGRCVA